MNVQQTYDLVVDTLKKHGLREKGWTFHVWVHLSTRK